jgi:hypothetical protein
LWAANVQVSDSASATTTTINWTSASILSAGYAGDSGYSGASGASGVSGYSGFSGLSGFSGVSGSSGYSGTGTAGASARVCYADVTGNSLNSTPTTVTTTGSTSFPPTNTWGGSEVWVATPPTIVAGHALFQSDGIYNPATGNTVWNVPYLSSLKVGSLQAISTNTGSLTVTGTFASANGNFSVDVNGVTTIRSATSGARMEISNDVIKVYDSTGTLRVKLGNLA